MERLKYQMHGLWKEINMHLFYLIEKADYCEIDKIISCYNNEELRDLFVKLSYETENLAVLGYVIYKANLINNEFWNELVIELLLNPYSFIEGAYSYALFYSKRQSVMYPTETNLERILFFNELPEKLIGDEEAEMIAKKVLEINPLNKKALQVFHIY